MGRILVVNEAEMAGGAILDILDIEGHSADVVSLYDAASDISFIGGFDLLIITAGVDHQKLTELLAQIRSKYTFDSLPVIVVFDEIDEAQIREYLDMGVNDYIIAPMTRLPVSVKLNQLLSIRRLTLQNNRRKAHLLKILNNNTYPIVLLSEDAHILGASRHFRELFGCETGLFGVAVSCVNAVINAGRCGETANCGACVIRRSVIDALETGEDLKVREGTFKVQSGSGVKETVLRVSAIPFLETDESGVLLSIDDVTGEKQAMKELFDRKMQYKRISDFTYDWELFRGVDGRLIYCSPAVERILGYTVEEYKEGISFSDIIHPDDYERAMSEYNRALAGEVVSSCIVRMIRKDHKMVWVDICSQPVVTQEGDYLGLRSSIRDITQIKDLEAALKESEAWYKLLAEYSNDWEVFKDKNAKTIYSNNQIEKILGYTVDEYMSKLTMADLIHPDDMEESVRSQKKALAEQITTTQKFRMISKNKEVVYIDLFARPAYTSGGEYIGFRLSMRDITESVIAQQNLLKNKEMLDEAQRVGNVGHWEHDFNEGRILFSDQMYRILEVSPDEYVPTLENIKEFFHPEDRTLLKDVFAKIKEDRSPIEVTHRIVSRLGKEKYVTMRAVIEYDKEENPVFSFGTLLDVTNLKQAELVLFDQKMQLQDLNMAKDKLFSIIAHDLKNPFASLFLSIESLQRYLHLNNKERALAKADTIYNVSKQCFLLLENLLEWSQAQRGTVRFNAELISVRPVIEKCFDLVYLSAENKKITLLNQVDDNLMVFADENMLTSVVRNLLTNAIKFSYDYGTVEVNACCFGGYIQLSVSDNGIGMDSLTMGRLFNLAENTTVRGTKGEKGTGLGLILCKEFIEKHRGKIWVESQPGKGCAFKFTLPIFSPLADM